MKTLEEIRDFINENEDWDLAVSEAIKENGFIDERHEDYGICSHNWRKLVFNSMLYAEILDFEEE